MSNGLMHATRYIKAKRKRKHKFLLCDGGELKPIQENCVVGYIDKMDKRGNAEVNAFSVSLNGKSIENYFKSKKIKKSIKRSKGVSK